MDEKYEIWWKNPNISKITKCELSRLQVLTWLIENKSPHVKRWTDHWGGLIKRDPRHRVDYVAPMKSLRAETP